MASIRFGGGIVDARGSIAGNTFSRNAGGAYQRARTAPTNPQTTRQSAVRNALGQSAQEWRTLDEEQRTAWVEAATTQQGAYVNRIGESEQYTGQQLYMAVQQRRNTWALGGGTIPGNGGQDPPPLTPAPPSVTLGTITGSADAEGALVGLSLAITAAAAENQVMIFASPPVSAGVMRSSTPRYALLGSFEDVATPSVSLLAEYNAAYGAVVLPGSAIWLKVVTLSNISWRMSAPVFLKVVITLDAG